ncbi:MAG: hypothetical protein KF901_28485 [Myxococcales bacterium]|nr:hypothetical protein [Myxococcales bacterium]
MAWRLALGLVVTSVFGCGAKLVTDGDGGVTCRTDETNCFGACVSLRNDPAHCGACGTTCGTGEVCSAGECGTSCGAGTTECSGRCRDLQTDREHCGGCGEACGAGEVCSAGACTTSCGGGTTDCDGVCRDLQTDRNHCGGCGEACGAGEVCSAGTCTTSCGAGTTDCDGVCRDLQTDRNHCGGCGEACAPGQACVAGECALSCPSPQVICGDTCVDLGSDVAHCGGCGAPCAAGQVCSLGECALSCADHLTECSGSCVELPYNVSHCTACDAACGPYANAIPSCNDGCLMTCEPGFRDCNDSRDDGCEVELATDALHCGACGNACSFRNAGASCVGGACVMGACAVGYDDCDGNPANGCECRVSIVGPPGAPPFSDGTLRDLDQDPGTGAIRPSGDVSTRTNDFLWIVNTGDSTVSRWDAESRTELARYRVGLAAGECLGQCCWSGPCNQPSRVVVDGNGDAYVANRGFSMQGTVTKIAGDVTECVDRNGNGVIDTSNSATPLAWDADECVLWNVPVGPVDAVLRALAIDRGSAARPNGYVWVGSYNRSRFWRLDPNDGSVLNELAVSGNPYGAVVTGDGTLWVTELGGARLQPINTETLTVGSLVTGLPNSMYGPAADTSGRIWYGSPGSTIIIGYDPATGTTTRATLRAGMSNGITIDASGNIWAGVMDGGGVSSLARFPTNAFVPGASIGSPGTLPSAEITYFAGLSGATGQLSAVGADRAGDIWLASYGGNSRLLHLDVATGTFTQHLGPNNTYSYSDFTGSVRRASIPQGSYTQTFDLGCDNPTLQTFGIDGSFPAGSSVTVSMRSAATVGALPTADDVSIGTLPPNDSPYDMGAAFAAEGETPARQLRLTLVLRTSEAGDVPFVEAVRLVWSCP